MRLISSQTELEALIRDGKGLIYNDRRREATDRSAADTNVLHAAWCPTLRHATVTLPKYFASNLADATAWLNANRGHEGTGWIRDPICGAVAREISARRP